MQTSRSDVPFELLLTPFVWAVGILPSRCLEFMTQFCHIVLYERWRHRDQWQNEDAVTVASFISLFWRFINWIRLAKFGLLSVNLKLWLKDLDFIIPLSLITNRNNISCTLCMIFQQLVCVRYIIFFKYSLPNPLYSCKGNHPFLCFRNKSYSLYYIPTIQASKNTAANFILSCPEQYVTCLCTGHCYILTTAWDRDLMTIVTFPWHIQTLMNF